MTYPVISADSHITEAPNTYIDYIDAKWKDKAPVMKNLGEAGDVFVIDGMKRPVPMGLVAAAGKPPEEIRVTGSRFEDLHRDSTCPWSQEMLAEHAKQLSEEQRRAILCDNTAELYQIDLSTLQ